MSRRKRTVKKRKRLNRKQFNLTTMSKNFDDNARETMESLKQDIVDYKKEVEGDKLEEVQARESRRQSEVRWAKAVIALDEFKTEYGI